MEASYSRFIRRVKAALVDSFVLALIMVSVVPALAGIESLPHFFRILITLLPIFLFEPVLVTLTGGSPGHHLFRIKIRNIAEDRKLSILKSIIRFIVKAFLGFISLTLILFTKKHQALHDIASGSIVVLKSPEKYNEDEILKENVFKEKGYEYPHIARRIIVSLFYIVILNLLLGVPSVLFISEPCINGNVCSQQENVIQIVIGIFWIAASIAILINGLKGKAYGARRKLVIIKNEV